MQLQATNSAGVGTATLTLTVADASGPPVITSPLTASGFVGQPFTYQITSTQSRAPTTPSPLPPGLTINTDTGLISGTPTTAGSYSVKLIAEASSGDGTANLALTISTVTSGVVNDDFAGATVITGLTGTVAGNNVGTTKERGEPNHAGKPGGASVWYRWTAPAGGTVTFDTLGSVFDTLLGVYTGVNVNQLAGVAANDGLPAELRPAEPGRFRCPGRGDLPHCGGRGRTRARAISR